MLRWGHFNARICLPLAAALALLGIAPLAGQNRAPARAVTFDGTLPAAARVRIEARGPVSVEGTGSGEIVYSVSTTSRTSDEAAARTRLQREGVRTTTRGGWLFLSSAPGVRLTVKAPRLAELVVTTSGGTVSAGGIEGSLEVHSDGGEIAADRIGGKTILMTGGGEIRVGTVEGSLRCVTGAGRITVESARADSVLESNGGDITAGDLRGPATLQTAAGTVRVAKADGSVTAVTGGGEIFIGQARGVVTARNMAGPVRVGSAAGVRCESGSGAIHLENVSGAVRVSTAMGSIFANLLAGGGESSMATGGGDITVTIPSNVGVTIRAENEMADTIRRIVSEFPALAVRMAGTRVVAEGAVNGGGPVLRISDASGTIYIKRQR